jgi:formate dehydrogenase major subunit
VIEPLFESKTDHEIIHLFAKKFGFADRDLQEHQGGSTTATEPNIEDITREFNRGMWTIGYTGQSPER